MKPFEDYLTREERRSCLRDEQWRRERDRRRVRETQRMRRLLLVSYLIGFLLVLVAAAFMTTAEAADEPEVMTASIVLYDQPPIPEAIQEDFENEKIEAALLEKANVIENATITHYCSELRPHICGTGNGITASGRPVTPYISVAVDPRIIPLGSEVMLDYGDGEIHYYRADDTGSGVNGNHIDVAVTTHEEALNLGVKTATVYWIPEEAE